MSTALARSPTATTSWWSTLAFLTTRFPLGVAGGVILLVFVFAAVFAGVIAPLDPFSTNAAARLAPPGGTPQSNFGIARNLHTKYKMTTCVKRG